MVKEVWYDEVEKVAINGRVTEKILKDGRNLIITDEQSNITRKDSGQNPHMKTRKT